MIHVAMLSGWHVHARDYARELQSIPGVAITVVWDEEPERGRAWAAEMGVPFEPELARAVARDDVDAVVVDAPTNRHAEVMIAAADAGKHVFTEKVMAITTAECRYIAEAVRKAGVNFCISFPARTMANHLYVKKAAEDNLLGDITVLRVRVAHDASSANWLPPHFYDPVACGGGAMMDLGAHPMYLARWILGKPLRISAMFNHVTGHAVEDNAVATIEFENKAIAIVETSFVSGHCPMLLELYGTEGTLFAGGPLDTVMLRSKKLEGAVAGWIKPDLPAALPRPIFQWIDAIKENRPSPFGLDDGIQLTELMEGAYAAHEADSTITFSPCPERYV